MDDVDFALRQLTIWRSEWQGVVTSTNGTKVRFVPMTERLSSALSVRQQCYAGIQYYSIESPFKATDAKPEGRWLINWMLAVAKR